MDREAPSPALLIAGIFIAATCGLLYELVAGTLASYLLGDSIKQFSLVIGVFLSSMGAGAFISQYIQKDLLRWFIAIEIALGLIGGLSGLIGFAAFAYTPIYVAVLFLLTFAIGAMVGTEIPIVLRLIKKESELRVAAARVLSADYVGSLVASLVFPFVLMPWFGVVRAALLAGIANVLVGLIFVFAFKEKRILRFSGALAAIFLMGIFGFAGNLTSAMEDRLYSDEIVLAKNTEYQRMVVTKYQDDVRLFLNGHLQFSTRDEYRYHESLVHPAMSLVASPREVLILGGGDGMTAREVLKTPGVEKITLVDIDPAVTQLFQTHELLSTLNAGALGDPKVHIHNRDAAKFLEETQDTYDVIILDLPDPSSSTLGRLYSTSMARLLHRRLRAGGSIVTQATSPFFARQAFSSVLATLRSEFPNALPYRVPVPSFGLWGFVVAQKSAGSIDPESMRVSASTRFLSDAILPTLFVFPKDMDVNDGILSTLTMPKVVELYRADLHRFYP